MWRKTAFIIFKKCQRHYEQENITNFICYSDKTESSAECRLRAGAEWNQQQRPSESAQDWEHWSLLRVSESGDWEPWVASQVTEPTFLHWSHFPLWAQQPWQQTGITAEPWQQTGFSTKDKKFTLAHLLHWITVSKPQNMSTSSKISKLGERSSETHETLRQRQNIKTESMNSKIFFSQRVVFYNEMKW